MIIFPAIDIRKGNVVRLQEGDFNRETVFGEDPLAMARTFAEKGASYLHVVDLDGAKGDGDNSAAICAIASELSIPVQTGGGIRDMQRITELIEGGVTRVILGTAAFKNPDFLKEACSLYPDCIAVSIDVKDGLIATHGWQNVTDIRDTDYLNRIEEWGVNAVVYTDIARDGMLQGVNLEAIRRVQSQTTIPVIASGGVTSMDDIQALAADAVYGAIIGRALYSGDITFEALTPYL